MTNPDYLIAPVVTEKSAKGNANGIYTFKFTKNISKTEIKSLIEKQFGVHVKSVNTLITKPKARRVGKYPGKTKTYKKAIVTLQAGETIEI